MDDAQRVEIKRCIREQMAAIRQRIEESRESKVSVAPDAAIGRLSRLDTMLNQGIANASLAQLQQRIIGLEQALNRLDDTNFGYCEECGERIPQARLKVLPESLLCVKCAE